MLKSRGKALLGALLGSVAVWSMAAEVTAGDYRVATSPRGWQIFWRDRLVHTIAWPCVVEGPGWKRQLMGEAFWNDAKYTVTGDTIVAAGTREGCSVELRTTARQDGVELSFRYDTAVTPLEDASFWFAALPLDDFGGCCYRVDGNAEVFQLPPVIKRETEPKSRWRISGDMKQLTIYTSRGNLELTGTTPFHLFDGRFHGYFSEPARSILATTSGKLEAGREYRFQLRMTDSLAIVPELIGERPPLAFQPLHPAPVIDGDLKDASWAEAGRVTLKRLKEGTPERPTEVWTGYDDEMLYVAFRCDDPRGATLADLPATREVYDNDCVEVFLNTEGSASYKHLILDIKNRLQINYAGARPLYELAPEQVRHAVKIDDAGWSAELAIPLAQLGLTPDTDLKLSGNVTRSVQPDREFSTAAPMQSSFHEAHRFLPLFFSGRPAPRDIADANREIDCAAGTAWFAATVWNSGDAPVTVLPRLLHGASGALKPENAAAVTVKRSAPVDFHFTVTPDDQELFVQLYDDAGAELLASTNPYFFAQISIGRELAALPEKIAALDNTGRLDDFIREVREIAERYSRDPQATGTEAPLDLILTGERLEMAARRQRNEALEQNMDYYLRPSLEKIFAAAPLPGDTEPGGTLTLSGAGDEVVNAQVVLLPLTADLGTVTVTATDLAGATSSIPASAVTVYREIPVSLEGKLWPDRLTRHPAPLPRRANQQPYWVEVAIPPGLPAGEYRGAIRFAAAGGGQLEVPVAVTASGYDLPRIPKVFAWGSYSPEFFDNPADAERFARELMERDLFPTSGVSHPRYLDTTDFRFNALGEEKLERFHMAVLAMFPWIEWLETHYPDGRHPDPADYYEAICKVVREDAAKLAARGKLDQLYAYYDEINSEQDDVKDMLMKLKRDTGIKIVTCFCTPSLGTAKMAYYDDMVDLYFFSDGYFTDPVLLDYIAGLQKRGRLVGWYFNLSYPKFPTSNCIDAPGVANRIQLFQQWKYGIDISLYWGMNCWWVHDFSTDPLVLKNRGDGILFYPDAKYGFEPSIRSELLREGTQDYRYLHYLKQLRQEADDRGIAIPASLQTEVADILAVNWIPSIVDYPLDPAAITGQRARIAAAIEQLRRLL